MTYTTIEEIVKTFDMNIDVLKSRKEKNESETRKSYIDPMFELLGWNLQNINLYEHEKEVIAEYSVKGKKGTKKADYSFNLNGNPMFFVEAKDPQVNIENNKDVAFQLRSYCWNAKIPVGILTDFEEFSIYDGRYEPKPNDSPNRARIKYYNYKEYADKWQEIKNLFSKEAVLNGSLNTYISKVKIKKGVLPVDEVFLKDMESWREILAVNIASSNPELSRREINFAVQRTIDRIVFLRICEDRGTESYGEIESLKNKKNIYSELMKLFKAADQKYNSGIFCFKKEKGRLEEIDTLSTNLKIDDDVLKPIIERLYYPSPYNFAVMSADILGQIYERFLGKVIEVASDRKVTVEEKPEVRKAGGVYYTPTYIVDYIVKNTIGKLIQRKSPTQVAKMRFLDPACGSGSFLILAYQHLLDWHLAWYLKKNPEKYLKGKKSVLVKDRDGNIKLSIDTRKQILLNNIFGVDIDFQAVEVTKLSLLLKVLEGENDLTMQLGLFKERALPDLGKNIKCGNSLIGPDYYENVQLSFDDEDEILKVNVFDWNSEFPEIMKNGGFDAVIGNPPYDVMEKQRGKSSWPHNALSDYVKIKSDYQPALGGKLNLYRFFLIRSVELIRYKGLFGMIIPLSLIADISCSQTRQYMLISYNNLTADCFPQKDNPHKRIFFDAKLSTSIICGEKIKHTQNKNPKIITKVYPANSFSDQYKKNIIFQKDSLLLDPKNLPIPLVNNSNWKLCKKIHSQVNIFRLAEIKDFIVRRGEINQTIYRNYIKNDPNMEKLLKGVEVGRYKVNIKLSQGYKEWFDEKKFLKEKPEKSIVNCKRIATQRITGVDERLRIVATIIEPKTYFADSTNSISIETNSSYSLMYLLGLLNSVLFQWRFKITSTNNNVGTNELNSLPFRKIDFSDPIDKSNHDKMINLVNRIITLHQQFQESTFHQSQTVIQRQIEATDRQIDQLVYKLYGLTEDEIKIVEEG